MGHAKSALRGNLTMHFAQAPVSVRPVAVVQIPHVRKLAQGSGKNTESVRFKIFLGGFQSHRIYNFQKHFGAESSGANHRPAGNVSRCEPLSP